MKLYIGKFYIALRLSNDLCVGIGKPDNNLRAQADLSRRHRGI